MRRLAPLLILAACGPAPAAPRAPDIGNQAPDVDAWLAWNGADAPVTVMLDAGGRELGRADGALVTDGATLWRVETRRRELALPSCN